MNKVFIGDCRDTMSLLIAQGVKVQCCVTSPPYFGLRDYKHPGQAGLENTPEEYVATMLEVFTLVREMLSDDGVLWLNLGDSYSNGGRKTRDPVQSKLHPAFTGEGNAVTSFRPNDGAKPKDLLGIPWRVAFALQAAGWYLRSDIIWSKPNPMPESVRDRPTRSHEYIFLLSKNEHYYYDADAIKESGVEASAARRARNDYRAKLGWAEAHHGNPPKGLSRKQDKQRGHGRKHAGFNGRWDEMSKAEQCSGMRNKRDVWIVATQPYSEAHFATFPPKLIEPCVLAGSRPGDVILDPFIGSGTTAQVAECLGRQWIGCEINPDYSGMQKERTAQQGMAL